MNDYESLKNRVTKVIEECEALLDGFEVALQFPDSDLLEQVKEIEKTIGTMQKKGLTVPPELMQLKLALLSDCDAVGKMNSLRKEFIDNIHRIFSFQTANKKKTIPHTLRKRSMIKISISLPPDGTLCKFNYKNALYEGKIKDRQIFIEGFGLFSSFSSASVKISSTSRNGWLDWELWIPGSGQWILADIWRKKQTERKQDI